MIAVTCSRLSLLLMLDSLPGIRNLIDTLAKEDFNETD